MTDAGSLSAESGETLPLSAAWFRREREQLAIWPSGSKSRKGASRLWRQSSDPSLRLGSSSCPSWDSAFLPAPYSQQKPKYLPSPNSRR